MIDLICSSPLDDDSMHKYPLDILSEVIHEVRSLAMQLSFKLHGLHPIYTNTCFLYIFISSYYLYT